MPYHMPIRRHNGRGPDLRSSNDKYGRNGCNDGRKRQNTVFGMIAMGETMLIMRKRLIPGSRVEEGLRLSAAMLGMDYLPNVVFVDDGVEILLPYAIYKGNLKDYLMVMSDLAGIYVLQESLIERGLTLDDIEPSIDATLIDSDELGQMAKKCTIITSF
jgi:sulfur relay (sulfurtransferase) DsrF/TusC family protein